jgi:hypothetical protein
MMAMTALLINTRWDGKIVSTWLPAINIQFINCFCYQRKPEVELIGSVCVDQRNFTYYSVISLVYTFY